MNERSIVTGQAEKLLPGGEALVTTERGNLLVANVLPGETVSIRPEGRRRGTERGILVDVGHSSPQRVAAPCAVAATCGGCRMQYMTRETEAAIKSQWVRQPFEPFLDPDSRWQPVVPAEGAPLRRRLRWHVERRATQCRLGFRRQASHLLAHTDHCMAIAPELDRLRNGLERELPAGVEAVQAVQLADGIHLVLESSNPITFEPETTERDGIPVQWWNRAGSVTRPLNRPVAVLHDRLPAGGRDIEIAIGPDDFVQGQVAGNRQLVEQIIEWSSGAGRVADLFAGVGNLSLPLAALGMQVVGGEVVAASVRAANANAKRLGVDARYFETDLFGRFDTEPFSGADVLILDPPRKGAKQVCRQLGTLLPERIIMVNCDPAAGGRDAAALHAMGYRLRALRALDLFPMAGHVEALSLWSR